MDACACSGRASSIRIWRGKVNVANRTIGGAGRGLYHNLVDALPADVGPGVSDVSFLGHEHPMFDCGEGLLDRVDVREIGQLE